MSEIKQFILDYMAESKDYSQLLFGLVHEMRVPLSPIIGFSEMLLMIDQGKANANLVNRKEALEAIKKASNNLVEISIGLLEFAKQQDETRNQDFQQLIVNLTVEMRRYLSPIDGYTALLLMIEDEKIDSKTVSREEALQTIKDSSNHILELTSVLFEIAKSLDSNNPEE
jgi:signal transduction histidine kinase